MQHGTINSEVEETQERQGRYKYQLEQANKTLLEQVSSLHQQLETQRNNTQARDKMIAYLDKLLIERDNAQHAAHRKQKKAEK